MNFYKHHLGDYAAATSHLSWDEDMAYTRLMRFYYQHEKPIPADKTQACRLVRATTPSQKRAVETVLSEFFVLIDGEGWRQKRCDEEIASMQSRAEKNREIGKRGGRPKKTENEPIGNPNGFEDETQTVSKNNPSQKPETTSQKPEVKQQHNHGGQSRAAEGDVERHVVVSVLLRSLGVSPMTGAHPMAMAFANTGASDEQLRAAVEIARERKPAPQPISPNYLQPILAEVLNPPEMRPKKRDAWWLTNESMSAKARELGISEAYRGEEPHAFKARIQQAIEAQGRVEA